MTGQGAEVELAGLLARLRSRREEKGWVLKDLADRLNVSLATVGHYETGARHPDEATFKKWIDALDMPPELVNLYGQLRAEEEIRRALEGESTRGRIAEDDVEYIVRSIRRAWIRE